MAPGPAARVPAWPFPACWTLGTPGTADGPVFTIISGTLDLGYFQLQNPAVKPWLWLLCHLAICLHPILLQ